MRLWRFEAYINLSTVWCIEQEPKATDRNLPRTFFKWLKLQVFLKIIWTLITDVANFPADGISIDQLHSSDNPLKPSGHCQFYFLFLMTRLMDRFDVSQQYVSNGIKSNRAVLTQISTSFYSNLFTFSQRSHDAKSGEYGGSSSTETQINLASTMSQSRIRVQIFIRLVSLWNFSYFCLPVASDRMRCYLSWTYTKSCNILLTPSSNL